MRREREGERDRGREKRERERERVRTKHTEREGERERETSAVSHSVDAGVGNLNKVFAPAAGCEPILGHVDIHSVEFEGFDFLQIWVLRDQICTTEGPNVNCLMHVDF